MACDVGLSVYPLSFSLAKIKLMLVLVTLVCETCICTVPETSEMGETADEAVNQLKLEKVPSYSHSLESQDGVDVDDDDDLTAYKRHLGAIAAMSGSKPLFGGKSFVVPPSKKHLGSIAAAQSTGRAAGRKLDLPFPSRLEMYKRHLGSLRAVTGYKSKPLTRSLKESSPAYQMDSPADTLGLEGGSPMTYNFDGMTIPTGYGFDSQEVQISPKNLMMNADEPTNFNEFQQPMSQAQTGEGIIESVGDDERTYKSKRFLGQLARGGWFPRQFRGIISENNFGKRHIGSLARLGWMPQSKGTGRLAPDEQIGEIGWKRNDISPRRRMLYHFTAPSLWTSPRGK